MAIAFIAVGCTGSSASTSSLVTGSQSLTANAAVVIGVSLGSTSASVSGITTSKSDTGIAFVAAVNSGSVRTELWYIPAAVGGSTTYTVGINSGPTKVSVVSAQYSGVVAFGASPQTNAVASNGSGTVSLTTQDTNNFVVCAFGSDGTQLYNSTFSTGTFRQRISNSGAEGSIGDNTNAAATSVTCTAPVASGTPNHACVAFELRSTSGGGFTAKQRRTTSSVGTRVGSRQAA